MHVYDLQYNCASGSKSLYIYIRSPSHFNDADRKYSFEYTEYSYVLKWFR